MNTKNNRRRRESIERIERAFIELLQHKELNDISVSEICKICGLNRSTFYANFVDLYDLADKMCIRDRSTPVCAAAIARGIAQGRNRMTLTTDDFRIPAIRSYLKLGFLPVVDGWEMRRRWQALLAPLGRA